MKSKRRIALSIFFTFLKIGAFTFGGGYAMIPLIEREAVEKECWIESDELLEVIAVAESTPGPIAINAATFVGYRACGLLGAFLATLGVVLPSFCIILALTAVLDAFRDALAVRFAFEGIRAGVLALILKALYSMFRKTPKGILSYSLIALSFVAVALLRVNAIYVIFLCAVIGLVLSFLAERRAKRQ